MTQHEYPDFSSATNTIVVSDLHLTDAAALDPRRPLWKRYKQKELFIDDSFSQFLDYLMAHMEGQIELVLNGDIFDFDSVMAMPDTPSFNINWIERRRGMSAEEEKSQYKISVVLRDHAVWVNALRRFILAGNRVVFVVGNHDIELNWPAVQRTILEVLDLPPDQKPLVRFCEWFYLSNGDTLIEHGHQYDPFCVLPNTVHPFIRKGKVKLVRVPFGNTAERLMLNGMGMMNPHVDQSFIKDSIADYLLHFYRHVIWVQPFLVWSWFWSAVATLIYSSHEGFLPSIKNPREIQGRLRMIAQKSNAQPELLGALRALHAHPVIYNPLKVMQELWLDRVLLFIMVLFFSFQVFSLINIFTRVSFLWFLIPFCAFFPAFLFYARHVHSDVMKVERKILKRLPLAAQLAGVARVIFGHTHKERHLRREDVEVINTGTWSPAYEDIECTKPMGKKCFAWIRPATAEDGKLGRIASLMEWRDQSGFEMVFDPRESQPSIEALNPSASMTDLSLQ